MYDSFWKLYWNRRTGRKTFNSVDWPIVENSLPIGDHLTDAWRDLAEHLGNDVFWRPKNDSAVENPEKKISHILFQRFRLR